ncbi:MAG: NAD(P)-binding domain-containing protein [Chloroflexi bacterium]|nr:NAD(P)-binding domain-containing protein [Chloroflexota bacterium]
MSISGLLAWRCQPFFPTKVGKDQHDCNISRRRWRSERPVGQEYVAIIGYGNMGRPVALNLRDSGVSVLVSEPREEKRDHAVREGFELFPIRDAVESADIIMRCCATRKWRASTSSLCPLVYTAGTPSSSAAPTT